MDDILFDIVNKGVYYDTATHLLQGGLASIHAVNIEGESILFKIIDVAKSGEPEDRDCYYEELLSRVIDGFEIEGYNCDGEYPLNRAIEKNNKFALDLLLEKGVNPNTLSKNGDTPLAHFIKEEDLGTVELLLEYGADPNLLDGSGKLPLLVAMDIENESDQIKFVDMLIKHGADIDLLPSITPPGNSPKPNVEGIDLDNPILSRDSEKSNGRGE